MDQINVFLMKKKAKEILSDFQSEEIEEYDISDTLINEVQSSNDIVIQDVSDNSSLKNQCE